MNSHNFWPRIQSEVHITKDLTKSPRPVSISHDDVIKWKNFPRYGPFVRGIHRSPVNSPHKGHWRGALMFSLICAWINYWVNNGEAGDLRRYRIHCDVTVMQMRCLIRCPWKVSKLRYLCFELSDRSKHWQVSRQYCRISKRYGKYHMKSLGFESWQDLTIKVWWVGTKTVPYISMVKCKTAVTPMR